MLFLSILFSGCSFFHEEEYFKNKDYQTSTVTGEWLFKDDSEGIFNIKKKSLEKCNSHILLALNKNHTYHETIFCRGSEIRHTGQWEADLKKSTGPVIRLKSNTFISSEVLSLVSSDMKNELFLYKTAQGFYLCYFIDPDMPRCFSRLE